MLRNPTVYGRKRRRPRVPFSLKAAVMEIIFGLIFTVFTFPISLLIATFSVWVSKMWMVPASEAMRNFLMFLALVQGLFTIIPVYHRQFLRTITSVALAAVLAYALLYTFGFNPLAFFGY